MRQVIPEPIDQLVQRSALLLLSQLIQRENLPSQQPRLIYQHLIRPAVNVLEVALPCKGQLSFLAVGEREPDHVEAKFIEIFQENGLAQAMHKSLPLGKKAVVRFIGSDDIQIE